MPFMTPTNKLLLRYYDDDLPSAEAAEVEAWIANTPAHRDYARALRDVVATGGDPASYGLGAPDDASWQTDEAWTRLQDRIGRRPPSRPPRGARRTRPDESCVPSRRQKLKPGSAGTATGRLSARQLEHGRRLLFLAMLLTLTVALLWSFGSSTEEAATRTVKTAHGKRTTLTLTDETTVHLAPGSTLRIPGRFPAEGRRSVHLSGEAYFQVARDEERPFVVATQSSTTEALGTAFNVRAVSTSEGVEVSVAEGRVALRRHPDARRNRTATKGQGTASESQVILTPGDTGYLTPGRGPVARRGVRAGGRAPAWTHGHLAFKATPLARVVSDLERWYDVEVTLTDSVRIAGRRVTATFTTEPVREVARMIAYLLELDFDAPENDHIVFRLES